VHPVTRVELLNHIEAAFASGPASRGDLLQSAINTHARPDVLEMLRRLPDGEFRQPRDLWRELVDVPIGG